MMNTNKQPKMACSASDEQPDYKLGFETAQRLHLQELRAKLKALDQCDKLRAALERVQRCDAFNQLPLAVCATVNATLASE